MIDEREVRRIAGRIWPDVESVEPLGGGITQLLTATRA